MNLNTLKKGDKVEYSYFGFIDDLKTEEGIVNRTGLIHRSTSKGKYEYLEIDCDNGGRNHISLLGLLSIKKI